jgi:hypothetical protein
MKLIIPKERRILVYSVLNEKIINVKQLSRYTNDFQVENKILNEVRNRCIGLISERENFYSIIYIHRDGSIETEINVLIPKYDFHPEYNAEY